MCERVIVHNCRTQHSIEQVILQTSTIAQMPSNGGDLKGKGKGFHILDTERWARS